MSEVMQDAMFRRTKAVRCNLYMLGEPVEKTGIADGEVPPRCTYHKAWFFIDHPKCLLHFVFCSKVERNRSPASECADSHNSNYHDYPENKHATF
uniref:Uncharacterized protein n=1 Tax=Panagrolaimus sp. PS1159 TaxID=55785 RepID=A0AC35EXE5_9BILA